MEKYKEEINYIDETSLEQLLQINKILHNAGVRRQSVLIYLFTNNHEKEQKALKVIETLQEENKKHFALLNKAIRQDKLKAYLTGLMVRREAYTNNINKVIEMKKSGNLVNALDDERSGMEFHYETYINYLEHLSEMLAANADMDIEEAVLQLKELRKIHTIIIIIGSLIILGMIIGVLMIATRLANDFNMLEKQTAERKEAEKKLRLANDELKAKSYELNKLNKHKDRFISVISHDLRNPLSSIIGSSSLLVDHPEEVGKKDSQRMLQIINRSAHSILQQLNELITLAKSVDTRDFFNPTTLNLAEAVNEDLRILSEFAERKKINVKNIIQRNVFIEADKFMFRSIFQNLITNALKYTGKGGEIIISANTGNGMVEITIADSGMGMKEEERRNLFSENVVSKQGTHEEIGTGMGLKLVKEFVEKHAGTITVESEEGKGTSVTFSLPKSR